MSQRWRAHPARQPQPHRDRRHRLSRARPHAIRAQDDQLKVAEKTSVCLARRLVPRVPESGDMSGDVSELASLFLQRLFLYVSNAAPMAHAEPDATTMAIEDLYLAVGGALLADGLRVATHGFLAGDRARLSSAAEQLQQAEKAYEMAAAEANLARLLALRCQSCGSGLRGLTSRDSIQAGRMEAISSCCARVRETHPDEFVRVSKLWPSRVTGTSSRPP